MQSLNSLYFPETSLPPNIRNSLLLFAEELHFLQPVEGEDSTAPDLFTEKGFCQAHTPVPLGKEKARFLGLIQEIQEQKGSNAEQFSSLTLAHLSEEVLKGEQSHRSIMATLTGGMVTEESEADNSQQEEKLWKARLVLALAEILDKEEAELAESFSDIDSSELSLFQELKGELDTDSDALEENDPFAELTRIRAKLNQQRPGGIKKRLQAWETFYASGEGLDTYWLWLTANEEAAELVSGKYERISNNVSVPLLRLNVPAQMLMREEDALTTIQKFRDDAENIRNTILEKLQKIVAQDHLDLIDPVALLPDAGLLARDWNDLIEYHFPQSKFGSQVLDLQFLGNFSLDQVTREKETTDGLCHSILAICRE